MVDSLIHGPSTSAFLPDHTSSKELADQFAVFFSEKIDKIRTELQEKQTESEAIIEDIPPLPSECILSDFEPASEEEVLQIIGSAPTKHCQLDPLPTWLLKKNLVSLVCFITYIIICSLQSGVFPESMRHAIVSPLLKKLLLDAQVWKNYRPVSNLTFLSKVLERVVAKRFRSHLTVRDLYEIFQSAYRDAHSPETALVRVQNDILISMDQGNVVALVLLDLSAAFDTVDHAILLRRLEQRTGLSGTVLNWFSSYLTGRTQSVVIDGESSERHVLRYGVPQGSVLGPILFTVYTLPIGDIIRRHGIPFHFFADDEQLYVSIKPPHDGSLMSVAQERLGNCVADLSNG